MKYDIHTPDEEIFDKYPELMRVEGFWDKNPNLCLAPKLIKYILAIYSKDTDFNMRKEGLLSERKKKVIKMLKINKSEYGDLDNYFYLKEEQFAKAVIQFLIFQDDYLWMDICATEAELEEMLQLRLQELDQAEKDKDLLGASKTKYDLGKVFQQKREYLQKCYEEFFNNDNEIQKEVKERTKTRLEDFING